MMKGKGSVTAVSCSIFKKEIEFLRSRNKLSFPVVYLDSMLHMFPDKLRMKMAAAVDREIIKGNKTALIFGECHPFISSYTDRSDTKRVSGMNCIEIFLGRDLYRSLRREGVFFLLPEWTIRWKDVFQKELGLNEKNAGDFMREMHTRLVYVDTGVTEIPVNTLDEISAFTGLPFEIMTISLDHFLKTVIEATEGLNSE